MLFLYSKVSVHFFRRSVYGRACIFMRVIMSNFLVWQDTWLLGIESFDADHKECVHMLNRIANTATNETLKADEDLDHLLELMDSLISHLEKHFEAEEAFMKSIGFPDFYNHKMAHTMEMAEFKNLRRLIGEGGAAPGG